MTSLKIVPLTSDRVEQTAELEKELFGSEAWSPDSIQSSIGNDFCFAALIQAEDGNEQTAGYIICSSVLDEGELLRIGVGKSFQRRGIAELLIDQLQTASETAKVNKWFLEVRSSNTPAINLYLKKGFKEISVRKNYYKTPDGREDALIMLKEISC